MRNHDEKARDMARSLLASTRRTWARDERRLIHRRERARVRAELQEALRHEDPPDHEGDLTSAAKGQIDDMVSWRRAWDNVAGFHQWVERTIERDPKLRDADPEVQRQHFAERLPEGMTGRHALFHVEIQVGTDSRWWSHRQEPARDQPANDTKRQLFELLEHGGHQALNRRLKDEWIDPCSADDASLSSPACGHRPRLLLGWHDIDAFALAARRDRTIAETLHRTWTEARHPAA